MHLLLIQEVIDKAMGVDRDINAMNINGRMGKIIQLDRCNGHRGKGFLFNERGRGVCR